MKVKKINALRINGGVSISVSMKGETGKESSIAIENPAPAERIFEAVVETARGLFPGEDLGDLINRLQKALRVGGKGSFRFFAFASNGL